MLEREIVMGGEESGGIGFQRICRNAMACSMRCCWPM